MRFSTLVHIQEGGYINCILNDSGYIMLDLFVPVNPGSNICCNFICNFTKDFNFRNLRSINKISGPYIYIYRDNYIHQQSLDLSTVDYKYIGDVMHHIISSNFSVLNTDCMLSNTKCGLLRGSLELCVHKDIISIIRNACISYKMKKIANYMTKRNHWKKWMEHWLDPNNKEGFIKRLRKYYSPHTPS